MRERAGADDLGDGGERRVEIVHHLGAAQGGEDQGPEPVGEGCGVGDGAVAEDDAARLEFADSAPAAG